MFTGIIQAFGTVKGVELSRAPGAGTVAHRLAIELGPLAEGLALGASVAINGACLTVARLRDRVADFDVIPETWNRTTLSELQPRDVVHLERALRVGDALDGHFVQGHVDGVGVIEQVEQQQGEWKLWISVAPEVATYIIPKGSIAVDGVSLTVLDGVGARFGVALVPTTLERTTFARRRTGERVNIETDMLTRAVLRRLNLLQGTEERGDAGLTWEKLQAGGFGS
jgi:riboflavin synthase